MTSSAQDPAQPDSSSASAADAPNGGIGMPADSSPPTAMPSSWESVGSETAGNEDDFSDWPDDPDGLKLRCPACGSVAEYPDCESCGQMLHGSGAANAPVNDGDENASGSPRYDGLRIELTIFNDPFGYTKSGKSMSWSELVEWLRNAPVAAVKDKSQLLKLATFGERRAASGCYRTDDNVLSIHGIEGDYDAEKVSLDEAVALLEKHGLRALLYTSWSHTAEAPKFRVLYPTSRALPPEQRSMMMARLNGALGGIFHPLAELLLRTPSEERISLRDHVRRRRRRALYRRSRQA